MKLNQRLLACAILLAFDCSTLAPSVASEPGGGSDSGTSFDADRFTSNSGVESSEGSDVLSEADTTQRLGSQLPFKSLHTPVEPLTPADVPVPLPKIATPESIDECASCTDGDNRSVHGGFNPSKVTTAKLLKKLSFLYGHWVGQFEGQRIEEFWLPGKASLEGYRLTGSGPTITSFRTLCDNRTLECSTINEKQNIWKRNCQLLIPENLPAKEMYFVHAPIGEIADHYFLERDGKLRVTGPYPEEYYLTRVAAHPSSLPAIKKRIETFIRSKSNIQPWSSASTSRSAAPVNGGAAQTNADSSTPSIGTASPDPSDTTVWQRYLACNIAGNDEAYIPSLSRAFKMSYQFYIKNDGKCGRIIPGQVFWDSGEESELKQFKNLMLRSAPVQYQVADYREGEWYEATVEYGFVSVRRDERPTLPADYTAKIPVTLVRPINGHAAVSSAIVDSVCKSIDQLPVSLREFLVAQKYSFVLAPTMEEVAPYDLRVSSPGYAPCTNGAVGLEVLPSAKRIYLFTCYLETDTNVPTQVFSAADFDGLVKFGSAMAWNWDCEFSDDERSFRPAYLADVKAMPRAVRKELSGVVGNTEYARSYASCEVIAALLGAERDVTKLLVKSFPRLGKVLRQKLAF